MKTLSGRSFVNEFTGSLEQDTFGAFLVRGAGAIGGSVVTTALLAAFLGR